MSFLIDQNEPEELDYWCSQSYEVKRGNWNQSGRFEEGKVIYPDITVVSNKIIGVNRKQAVEWMAGFSAWKDQVLRELNGPIDFLIQVIEGAITSTPREGLWGWDLNYPDIVPSTDRLGDLNGNGLLTVGGHVSNHDYKNLFGELIRISDSGIPTFFTGNTFGTALFLVELHKIADQEDWEPRLLTQLVKEKFLINEREIIRRNLILFLMGIPGVGQDRKSDV